MKNGPEIVSQTQDDKLFALRERESQLEQMIDDLLLELPTNDQKEYARMIYELRRAETAYIEFDALTVGVLSRQDKLRQESLYEEFKKQFTGLSIYKNASNGRKKVFGQREILINQLNKVRDEIKMLARAEE